MSLSSLRRTYGNGPRHTVLNRAIRAECHNGNSILDRLAAVTCQLHKMTSDHPRYDDLSERQRELEAIRAAMAKAMEIKHNVGVNTNRRKREVAKCEE